MKLGTAGNNNFKHMLRTIKFPDHSVCVAQIFETEGEFTRVQYSDFGYVWVPSVWISPAI